MLEQVIIRKKESPISDDVDTSPWESVHDGLELGLEYLKLNNRRIQAKTASIDKASILLLLSHYSLMKTKREQIRSMVEEVCKEALAGNPKALELLKKQLRKTENPDKDAIILFQSNGRKDYEHFIENVSKFIESVRDVYLLAFQEVPELSSGPFSKEDVERAKAKLWPELEPEVIPVAPKKKSLNEALADNDILPLGEEAYRELIYYPIFDNLDQAMRGETGFSYIPGESATETLKRAEKVAIGLKKFAEKWARVVERLQN